MNVATGGSVLSTRSYDPDGRFEFLRQLIFMGTAESYVLSSGERFDFLAGNATMYLVPPPTVVANGDTLQFTVEPPENGVLLRQSSASGNDFASHITLGIASPLTIIAKRGSSVATFIGSTELLFYEDIFSSPDPRFRSVSANVGDIVWLEIEYHLLRGEVWDETIFSRAFDYRTFGTVDFTRVQIDIDVKPGNEANIVNPESSGKLWIALLSSSGFDAINIDASSVTVGPTGAAPSQYLVRDVNRDGLIDLQIQISVSAAGFACGDVRAIVNGITYAGQGFFGIDTLATTGCR